jgi:hypothetical protein
MIVAKRDRKARGKPSVGVRYPVESSGRNQRKLNELGREPTLPEIAAPSPAAVPQGLSACDGRRTPRRLAAPRGEPNCDRSPSNDQRMGTREARADPREEGGPSVRRGCGGWGIPRVSDRGSRRLAKAPEWRWHVARESPDGDGTQSNAALATESFASRAAMQARLPASMRQILGKVRDRSKSAQRSTPVVAAGGH